MVHIQSFEVLSTKCVWSSDFICINIQLAQLKLGSLASRCQAQPLLGFAPLLEHQLPLLNDFELFLEKFIATFGDSNEECMFNIKIQYFCQISHSTMVYAS
jgi:hypothetical protein